MSGIGSAVGKVTGGLLDAFGARNKFRATGADLSETQYGPGIEEAMRAALSGTSSPVAGQQGELAQALFAQMRGEGPSLAQRQLQTATERNITGAAGQLAGVKGINPALAARSIAQNIGGINQEAAGQSAMTRLQEQLSTQGLLAQALAAQRGQDIGQFQANTALTGTLGGLQQGQNANRISNALGTQQINAGVSAQNANIGAGLLGGTMQGAGNAAALIAASDERIKTRVVRHPDEVIPGVPRATFEYRGAPGRRMEGVIAQDVERTHPELAGELPDGTKVVDGALAPHEIGDAFSRALLASRMPAHAYPFGGEVASIPNLGIPDYSSGVYAAGGNAIREGMEKAFKSKGDKPGGNSGVPGVPLNPFGDFASAGDIAMNPAFFMAHGGEVDAFTAALMRSRMPARAYAEGGKVERKVTAPTVIVVRPSERPITDMPLPAKREAELPVDRPEYQPDFYRGENAKIGIDLRPRDYRGGGSVPGRARVSGDDPRNDTVPALVSPGEIVIPRTVSQAPDAPDRAAAFVAAIKAKRAPSRSYGDVLAAQRDIAARLARLERRAEGGEIGEEEPKEKEEHAKGWDIAEKINEMLPAWLSGREGVLEKRKYYRKIDEQMKQAER